MVYVSVTTWGGTLSWSSGSCSRTLEALVGGALGIYKVSKPGFDTLASSAAFLMQLRALVSWFHGHCSVSTTAKARVSRDARVSITQCAS